MSDINTLNLELATIAERDMWRDKAQAALAREAKLREALVMAKQHMIVNDLSLPNVFAVIDAALEAVKAQDRLDKLGLQSQIGALLTILDGWDKERADTENGGLTMHTRGMTPDWYVLAAFWATYGFSPDDPRAGKVQP